MEPIPAEQWPLIGVWVVAAVALTIYNYGVKPLSVGADEAHQIGAHVKRRWIGGLVLGGFPALVSAFGISTGGSVASPNRLGLGLGEPAVWAIWLAPMVVVALPVLFVAAGGLDVQAHYPEMKVADWRRARVWSALSWAAYLFGYELLFRGVMLFQLREAWGDWPAVAAVTGLYVAVHFDKGIGETVMSIPMGFVFGALALFSGGVWAPWLLHTVIAVSSENFAVMRRPAST